MAVKSLLLVLTSTVLQHASSAHCWLCWDKSKHCQNFCVLLCDAIMQNEIFASCVKIHFLTIFVYFLFFNSFWSLNISLSVSEQLLSGRTFLWMSLLYIDVDVKHLTHFWLIPEISHHTTAHSLCLLFLACLSSTQDVSPFIFTAHICHLIISLLSAVWSFLFTGGM